MTAVNAFQAAFQSVPLTASVRRFAEGRSRPHSEIYRAGRTIVAPVGQQTVGWNESRMSRGLAALTGPTSPTKQGKKPGQIARAATLLDVKEHVDLPAEWLYAIQNPEAVGDVMVESAKAQLSDAADNLAERIANTIEFCSVKANEGSLVLGSVPNSELTGTLTYPVNSLAKLVSWAATDTKIRSTEINRVIDQYDKGAGFKPAAAVATHTVEGYLTGNVELQNFMSGNDPGARALESAFMGGGANPKFGGIEWKFHNAHYALDSAEDTAVDYQTADVVTFLPPKELWRRCFAMGEGHELIPRGPKFGTADGFEQLIIPMQGYWSYVEVQTNPVLIRLHAGYKFLPIQLVQKAVMAFDSV